MKRTIALRLISYACALVYAGVLVFSYIFFGEIFEYWFSLALLIIGIIFLIKSFMFELDSSLYISSFLIFLSASTFVEHFFMFDSNYFYPWHIFALAFASLAVFIVFRQRIHLKIFAVLGLEVLLLLIYKNYLLPETIFYCINGVYLAAIVLMIIVSLKKNTKKNSRSQ